MNSKARILLFTGDGKGKTTAALGTAIRAIGHGMKVFIIQFIKQAETGEIAAINEMENVRFLQSGLGFVPKPSSSEFEKHKKAAQKGLALIQEAIESGDYDLIILDEICVAIGKGLLEQSSVIDVLNKSDSNTTFILTGRNACQSFIEIADTVSEIKCIKHGFEASISAQKGVEF